jgi:hypothetical protein
VTLYGTCALHVGEVKLHAPSHRTHAHTYARAHTPKYVILTAILGQQWFRERTSVLHYTYIVSRVLV